MSGLKLKPLLPPPVGAPSLPAASSCLLDSPVRTVQCWPGPCAEFVNRFQGFLSLQLPPFWDAGMSPSLSGPPQCPDSIPGLEAGTTAALRPSACHACRRASDHRARRSPLLSRGLTPPHRVRLFFIAPAPPRSCVLHLVATWSTQDAFSLHGWTESRSLLISRQASISGVCFSSGESSNQGVSHSSLKESFPVTNPGRVKAQGRLS